ncbi:STAS domain-containing protein [Streptomyces sp. NPDC059010]|uniref:STAS domain-containing protein n=1 Tax=Streptomyces sp. NPDC059010 TaxID=3346695 RepID=UPI0036C68FA8
MRLFRFPHRPRHAPGEPRGREVVRLRGELDARNASATGRRLVRLINTGPEVLEVDLAQVKYVSPDGCEALFMALRAARARGTTRLVVTHANDRARLVMYQLGLSRALWSEDSDGS